MLLVPQVIVILLMLALNAVLAAYEMALASVPLSRLQVLIDGKKAGATDAFFMKQRIEGSLATVQLGITLAGAVAAATGGAGVEARLSPYLSRAWGISGGAADILALVLFVVPLSLATIILAELVPKVIALENRERVVLALSPAMRRIYAVAYPFIFVIEKAVKTLAAAGRRNAQPGEGQRETMQELRAAASLARATRLLGLREEKIILSAAELSSRPAGDIILPAGDISLLWEKSGVAEALVKAHLDMHTRFPVAAVDGDPQSIVGYANFKDIVSAVKTGARRPTVKDITRPIERADRGTTLSRLLETMIQKKTHIALVTEGRRVAGMVTMEDILEELVGEIEDEYDYLPAHIQPYGSAWIMGGGVTMEAAAAAAGIPWQGSPAEGKMTLEQWVVRTIGCAPSGGETVEAAGLRIMPRKFRRMRLAEAVVSRLTQG